MFHTNIPSKTDAVPELAWCPECQAPPRDDAHVHYCTLHMPYGTGECDRLVDSSSYIINTEAGGEANAGLCAFIHRGKEITS